MKINYLQMNLLLRQKIIIKYKILFLTILLVLNCEFIFSQNNGGFENWSTVNGYQEPDNWQTFNFLAAFGNPISATKVSGVDKYSGNYALKITTVHFTNKIIAQLPDSFGISFNGKVVLSPPGYNLGVPYTSRPTKLGFYAKYIPVGLDTGYAECTLFKRSPTKRDTIAIGYLKVLPSGTYQFNQIILNYRSTAYPDSAHIYFKSCNLDSTARRVGSAIYIDDVAFIGALNINKNTEYNSKITVFPNPANNSLTIKAQFDEADSVQIIDIFGNVLNTFKFFDYMVTINTFSYNPGCYFYKILSTKNEFLANGKIIINK